MYLLYLKEGKVYGLAFADNKFLSRIEASLEELPYLGPDGEGYLLLADEEVQYNVVSLPSSAKIQLRRVMMHEAEGMSATPASELIYRWRMVGSGDGEDFYLLAVIPGELGSTLLSSFQNKGLRLQKVMTFLDLLIERGRDVKGRGGGCQIFFEGEKIYILFFRDGSFLFHRIFELALSLGEERFGQELVLELKRSVFYLQQKHKIPVEWIQAISPPDWLDENLKKRIEKELKAPLEVVHGVLAELGPLDILAEGIKVVPRLLSFIPEEVELGRRLERISPALSLFLAFLLICGLVWVWWTWSKVRDEEAALVARKAALEQVEDLLQQRQGHLEELKRLRKEAQDVFSYLQKRSLIHLPLESLPYLIPPEIHLESLRWISKSANAQQGKYKGRNSEPFPRQTLQLTGRVDGQRWEQRYKAFWQLVEALRKAPFVQRVDFEAVELLKKGLFALRLELKGIKAGVEDEAAAVR